MRSVLLSCLLATLVPIAVAAEPEPAPTFADVRIAELDRWSEGMPLPDDSEASELAYDGTQLLSLVATSLLVRGDRGGMESSAATIAGASLADGLDAIHLELGRLGDETIPEEDREAARLAVRRFLREGRQRLAVLAVPAPDRLDRQLEELLSPLVEAIERLTTETVTTGWWPAGRLEEVEPASSRFASMFGEVDWLNTLARERVLERIMLVGGSGGQDEAIEVLHEIARLIESIRQQPGGRTLSRNLGRRFEEIVLFRDGGLPSTPALVETARVIRRMVEYRAMEMPEAMPRSSRRLYAALGRDYEVNERNMLEQLPVLLSSSSPRTDPGLVASIRAQALPLDRMRLLADSVGWANAFRAIDAPAGPPMERRLAVLQRDLGERATAEEAMLELEAIRDSMALLETLPGESMLAAPQPATDVLLAGTSDALRDELVRLRRSLVAEIVAGDVPGPAMSSIVLRRRLLALVERTMAMPPDHDSGDGLEGWSGWYGRPGLFADRRERLAARLRIASTALQEQEPEVARRQLELAEQDLAFMELFESIRQRHPAVRSDGGVAIRTLGRLARSPGSEVWMLEHRDRFARLARCLLELDAALVDGRVEDAAALEQQSSSIVRALGARLDPR